MSLSLLCSSRCPASLVVAGLDVAIALKDTPVTIVSGFQSPLEKESLKFLLKGSVRIVVCPARSVVGMRIPAEYKKPMAEGRLTIRSFIDEQSTAAPQSVVERPKPRSVGTTACTVRPRNLPKRPTTYLAEQRNRFACDISDVVLILHASPGGKLERLASELLASGKPVWTLDDPANRGLLSLEAVGIVTGAAEQLVNLNSAPAAHKPH